MIGPFLGKGYVYITDKEGVNYYICVLDNILGGITKVKSDAAIVNIYSYGIQFSNNTFAFIDGWNPINLGSGEFPIPGAEFVMQAGDESKSQQLTLELDGDKVIISVQFKNPPFNGTVIGSYEAPGFPYDDWSAVEKNKYIGEVGWNLELITPGFDKWPSSPGYMIACHGCNLSMLTMDGGGIPLMDLQGADLSHATFEDAAIVTCNFSKAKLNDVIFKGANFSKCDFDATDLTVIKNKDISGTSWSESTLIGANISGLDFTTITNKRMYGNTLDNAVVTGANFCGVDFTQASLQNVDLQKANLSSDTVFVKTNLSKANLSLQANTAGINFQQANFSGALLNSTDLSGAQLDGCKFDQTDLTTIKFNQQTVLRPTPLAAPSSSNPRTSFVSAKLSAKLIGKNWSLLDLTDAQIEDMPDDLSGLDAQYSKISGFNLHGISLAGSNFSNSELNMDFGNQVFSPLNLIPSNFEGAILHQSNFSGAKLEGANLSQIQGGASDENVGIKLSQAYMPDAILTGAVLNGVNLAGAQIYGKKARLDNAVLEDADLSNATLSHLNLSEAKLRGATFDNANMIGVNLTGAALIPSANGKPTSFVGTNLIGANFQDAQLGGVTFSDAAIAVTDGVPFFKLSNPAFFTATLDKNQLSSGLRDAFSERNRTLKQSAVAISITAGSSWIILEYPDYELSYDDSTHDLSIAITGVEIMTIPNAANLISALDDKSIPQSLLDSLAAKHFYLDQSALLDVESEGVAWSISQLPSPAEAVGYHTIALHLNEGALWVYGSKLMISRLGDNNQLELVIIDVAATTITQDQFDANTVCPNRIAYGQQNPTLTWTEMLTAPNPSVPPTCVPSGDRWCPDVKFSRKS